MTSSRPMFWFCVFALLLWLTMQGQVRAADRAAVRPTERSGPAVLHHAAGRTDAASAPDTSRREG
jgi:hypothetical protein